MSQVKGRRVSQAARATAQKLGAGRTWSRTVRNASQGKGTDQVVLGQALLGVCPPMCPPWGPPNHPQTQDQEVRETVPTSELRLIPTPTHGFLGELRQAEVPLLPDMPFCSSRRRIFSCFSILFITQPNDTDTMSPLFCVRITRLWEFRGLAQCHRAGK